MKLLVGILLFSATIPFSIQANGSSVGRTLAPEIRCELPNGNVEILPPLYCKIYGGQETK
ncbi:hypothetical protein L3V31_13085 [Vibrio sp. J1-1]|uniref:hypothetical protein n=1 Tax=Vibrio sp. J1-1 TaxID=2912251 RepID=UPI001F23B1DB|nr:hypothetical protein [Vibrio sp. J1-1]MCF7482664.1 hypothetical protein [Vibrio sp. J1-1]